MERGAPSPGVRGEQLIHPDPRQTAKCNFKAAAPVDAYRVRIALEPATPLRHQFANILLIVRKQPCFRQSDQMLVAVQLPRDFVVAHRRELEKGNLAPRLEWRALVVHAIQMPIDLAAVIEIFISEQAKTVLADFIRLTHDFRGLLGQVRSEELCALGRDRKSTRLNSSHL